MSYYKSAAYEAIMYYAEAMVGNIKYKPVVYAQRMGWIGDDGKVTTDGKRLAKWILDADEEFWVIRPQHYPANTR